MIKKILFLALLGAFIFRLWQTTGCRTFVDYHLSALAIKITVEDHVNTDGTLDRQTSRFFHNKFTVGAYEYTKSYLAFFEPRFLLDILGPAGFALFILAIFQIRKQKFLTFHLLTVLIIATLIFTKIHSNIIFYLFAIALMSLSFWGIKFFPRTKSKLYILLLTIVTTYWYYSYSWQMGSICNEIFFN